MNLFSKLATREQLMHWLVFGTPFFLLMIMQIFIVRDIILQDYVYKITTKTYCIDSIKSYHHNKIRWQYVHEYVVEKKIKHHLNMYSKEEKQISYNPENPKEFVIKTDFYSVAIILLFQLFFLLIALSRKEIIYIIDKIKQKLDDL